MPETSSPVSGTLITLSKPNFFTLLNTDGDLKLAVIIFVFLSNIFNNLSSI